MNTPTLKQVFTNEPEQAYALFEAACRMADDPRAELAKAKEQLSNDRAAGVRDELYKALVGDIALDACRRPTSGQHLPQYPSLGGPSAGSATSWLRLPAW